MSEILFLILIVVFIVILIAIIHFYDRHLVKEINSYEERLEKKGIFKRHFIKNRKNQK
jgi:high-affinity nickel permease